MRVRFPVVGFSVNHETSLPTYDAETVPAFVGRHGWKAPEECAAGVLRSLGEGGQMSVRYQEGSSGIMVLNQLGATMC